MHCLSPTNRPKRTKTSIIENKFISYIESLKRSVQKQLCKNIVSILSFYSYRSLLYWTENASFGSEEVHLLSINRSMAIRPISSPDFATFPFPPRATPSCGWIKSINGLLDGVLVLKQQSPTTDNICTPAMIKTTVINSRRYFY